MHESLDAGRLAIPQPAWLRPPAPTPPSPGVPIRPRRVKDLPNRGVSQTQPLLEGAVAVDVEELYRRYGPTVVRRCRRLLREEAQAVDAAQDVFVQLLRHQAHLTDDAPAGLLMRMATRVCLNRLRSQRRRPEDPGDEKMLEIAHADDPVERSITRSVLRAVFRQELESTRTLAVLHLVDGLTLEQVAREVGLSVSGVRKRLRTLKARVAGLEAL